MDILKKIILAILAFFVIGSIVDPFINSTQFSDGFWLTVFLIGTILLVTLIPKWYAAIVAQGIWLLFFLHRYYPMNRFFTFGWLRAFCLESFESLQRLLRGGASYFPNDLALILFGLFILLLVNLLIRFHNWKATFAIIFIYLFALIAFNKSSITTNLIIFFCSSFISAVWFYFSSRPTKQNRIALMIAVMILSITISSAYLLPETFYATHIRIQSATSTVRNQLSSAGFYRILEIGRTSGLSAQSGFGENDSWLGGPLYQNNDPVFEAIQNKSHYWRIETKETYTGTGWQSSERFDNRIPESMVVNEDNTAYQEESYTITFGDSAQGITYLPLPYGQVHIDLDTDIIRPSRLFYSPLTQRIRLSELDENELSAVSYTVYEPYYELEQLQQAAAGGDPDELDEYLQLPNNLPQRVIDLAQSLTQDEETDYQKVKAVESYLKTSPDFRYSLSDAEYTPSGSDYVDFFLFDSQVGYCEQFSTSMVVLLRAVGIPARWAKGYTPGTITQRLANGLAVYQVTNANAHAWPEVYFEGIGWVPFEPTPSFSAPQTYTQTNSSNPDDPTSPTPQNPDQDPSSENPDLPNDPNDPGNTDPDNNPNNSGLRLIYYGIALSILATGIVLAWIFRTYLGLALWQARLRPERSFQKTYSQLLRYLEAVYWRSDATSLADYLQQIAEKTGEHTPALQSLTQKYETMYYGNQPDSTLNETEITQFKNLGTMLRGRLYKHR